jgi:2-iminobutanoate/2-iminopropanoate deaminase
LFISGQVPFDPATGNMVDGDIKAQTQRVLENIGALLSGGGLTYANVVRTTVYLADMNDFGAMNDVYRTFFAERRVTNARSACPPSPFDIQHAVN